LKEGMWPGKINNSLTERNNPQPKKPSLLNHESRVKPY